MRVLVAGGAGFIGMHVCQPLLARGDEVVVFDNTPVGAMKQSGTNVVSDDWTRIAV